MMERDLVSLFEDIKARKPEAFNQFFRQVEKRVYSFGVKVCGDREDARDIMQETLLQAFRSLPGLQFTDSTALNVWLYRVARNSCLMMRRKGKYEPERELSLEEFMPAKEHEGHPMQIPDWSRLPDEALMEKEIGDVIRRATLSLPYEYRLVLVLRDMEQLTTREVADILEISEQNVKIRLHRARLSLRQALTEKLAGERLRQAAD
ncbi:MAG: sigma-70 family RNA polymerase sigma factor [Blastocatellia bacterium]|nr:sigma-70 family RNA polymerase sigma factor [Blastocatellia bacterium]